jgi:hypothetical protein
VRSARRLERRLVGPRGTTAGFGDEGAEMALEADVREALEEAEVADVRQLAELVVVGVAGVGPLVERQRLHGTDCEEF